jgi:hypothetical protein
MLSSSAWVLVSVSKSGACVMEIGDIVRLKRSFRPRPEEFKEYRFAIVVGLVQNGIEGTEQPTSTETREILVYLYDPETSTTYTDELGMQAVFLFRLDEVEV